MTTPEEMRTDGWLAQELETYYTHKAELLEAAEGKHVLIKGEQIVGVYETNEEAFAEDTRGREDNLHRRRAGVCSLVTPGEDPMELTELLQKKREDILQIAGRHGASNVRVFGSVSRGEAGPGSDVDLLVDVDPKPSPWFPAGLTLDQGDLLGRQVDVATANALHWLIRDRVLSEAKPL